MYYLIYYILPKTRLLLVSRYYKYKISYIYYE